MAVELDGLTYPAFYGRPNKRAAKTLANDKFALSGFYCLVPRSRVGKGEHQIVLKIQTRGHQAVFNTPDVYRLNIQ